MNKAKRRFRSRYAYAVIMPVVLLASVMTVAAAWGVWSAAHRSDELSMDRQAREVRLAIGATEDELAQSQAGVAIWNLAVAELRKRRPDWRWVDNNLGIWLNFVFRHHCDFVLDADNAPVYGMMLGRRVVPSRYDAFAVQLQPLVDRARGHSATAPNPHERLPGFPPNPQSSAKTSPRAIHATDLVKLGGRVAAVSVMRMIPDTPDLPSTPGREPLLVSIRYLDAAFLRDLSQVKLIANAHVSAYPDVRAGQHAIALTSSRGRRLGYLIWRPELPGSALLSSTAPIAMLGVGGLLLALLLLAVRLARMMREDAQILYELGVAHAELKEQEAQAKHRAYHDILTGLANRAYFDETVDRLLEGPANERCSAVMLLDLDRFKEVNDTLGHAEGDLLLQQVAQRLLEAVGPSNLVARLGGDEFAVMLTCGCGEDEVGHIASAIVSAIHSPFDLNGCTRFVDISVGVKLAKSEAARRSELMREADFAMYQAKQDRGGAYRFFEDVHTRSRSETGSPERDASLKA